LKKFLTSQSFSSKKHRDTFNIKKDDFFCGQLVPLIQAKTIGNIKIIPEKTYFSVSSKQLKLEDKSLTMLPALKSDRLKKMGVFPKGTFDCQIRSAKYIDWTCFVKKNIGN